MRAWRYSVSRAFSLTELVLSLGVVSVALVSLLGMIPVALGDAAQSRFDSEATVLADRLLVPIRVGAATHAHLALGGETADSESIELPLATNGACWFRVELQDGVERLTAIPEAEYLAGIPESRARVAGTLSWAPGTSGPGMVQLTLELGRPVTAPAARRQTRTFVRFCPLP